MRRAICMTALLMGLLGLLLPGRPVRAAATFPDLAGHWAEAAVRQAVQEGWVNGYPDGRFAPEGQVTRAEFLKMLLAALKVTPVLPGAPTGFPDADGHWVATQGWLGAAWRVQLIPDYPDQRLEPDRAISREEIAWMTVHALGRAVEAETRDGASLPFSDTAAITYGKGYVETAVAAGIVRGFPDGGFHPQAPATRAQAVTMVARTLDARAAVKLTPAAGTWQITSGPSVVFKSCMIGEPEFGAGVARGTPPVNPDQGGTLSPLLFFSGRSCDPEKLDPPAAISGSGLSLRIAPFDGLPQFIEPAMPLASLSLPDAEALLKVGQAGVLPVTVGGGLAPGWYRAWTAGKVSIARADGSSRESQVPNPAAWRFSTDQKFLVTARAAGPGEVTAQPDRPQAAGVTVPPVSVQWDEQGTRLSLTLPDSAQVEWASVAVLGPGVATRVPGSQDGHGWKGGALPGEADRIVIRATVKATVGAGQVEAARETVTWCASLR